MRNALLGAPKHLYNWLCPSVGCSFRLLIGNAFVRRSTRRTLLAYLALFSMKHPHTIAFKHNLGKKFSHIDFSTTICLILYCFVYKICLIRLNLHEEWAQLTKFFYGFVNVTSSAIQWCIVLLNIFEHIIGSNSVKMCCSNRRLPFGTTKSVKSSKNFFFSLF